MYSFRAIMLSFVVAAAAATIASPVAAQKSEAPATETTNAKTAAQPKAKKKGASACAGLAQSQCASQKECGWITPKKKVSSNGRKLTAYCRKTNRGVTKSSPRKTASKKSANSQDSATSKKKTN